jgi:hypothetical protein
MMGRGAPVYVVFTSNTSLDIWEKGVTKGGWKCDDRRDTSTFHNSSVRTFSPGRLKTAQDIKVNCGYDPDQEQDLIDLVGHRDTITILLPTHTKYCFYGWLDEIVFNENNEKDDPMATLTLVQGNQDWSTCVEQPPVIVAGLGTATTC